MLRHKQVKEPHRLLTEVRSLILDSRGPPWLMAPWQTELFRRREIDGIILRAASSKVSSPLGSAAKERPHRSLPGYMASVAMIGVMILFIVVLV